MLNAVKPKILKACVALISIVGAPAAHARTPDYDQVSTAVQQMFASGNLDGQLPETEIFLRGPCAHVESLLSPYLLYSREYQDPDIHLERAFVELAFEVAGLRQQFANANFPAELWSDLLDQYERLGLQLLATQQPTESPLSYQSVSDNFDSILISLQQRLNEFSAGKNDYPMVVSLVECGDGSQSARVVTEPPGQTVQLITDYDYRLCEIKGIDPEDAYRCRWKTFDDGEVILTMFGYYHYIVLGGDGIANTGVRDLASENYDQKMDYEVPATLVFSK